jgi:putative N6-adenine-specific DNA methylase
MNPPYGRRVGPGDSLDGFYASLGGVLRHRWAGWRVAMLLAEPKWRANLKLPLECAAVFPNGGIRVGVWLGTIPEQGLP